MAMHVAGRPVAVTIYVIVEGGNIKLVAEPAALMARIVIIGAVMAR